MLQDIPGIDPDHIDATRGKVLLGAQRHRKAASRAGRQRERCPEGQKRTARNAVSFCLGHCYVPFLARRDLPRSAAAAEQAAALISRESTGITRLPGNTKKVQHRKPGEERAAKQSISRQSLSASRSRCARQHRHRDGHTRSLRKAGRNGPSDASEPSPRHSPFRFGPAR